MSRTIDPAVQAILDTPQDGTEIVVVLEVFWTKRTDTAIQTFPPPAGATERIWYADRPIPNFPEIKSSILELGNVDAAVQVTQGGQSKSLSVKLDDTNPDGELKQLFDTNDVHKTPVRVWFYIMGTDFSTKKFPIFLGQINTPVVWDEGRRTLAFTIVNRIEDAEVGFSAEEGEFPALPEELIGKTWPLCFGTVTNVPALKAVPTLSGVLANGIGIRDFTLDSRLQLAEAITCPITSIGFKCATKGLRTVCNTAFEDDQNCLQARCVEIEILKQQISDQGSFEYSQMTIFGGELMPQGWNTGTQTTGGTGGQPVRAVVEGNTGRLNTLTLNIQGGLFTGFFDGTPEEPSQVFVINSRQHPRFDPATGTVLVDPVGVIIESKCPSSKFAGEDSDSNFIDTFRGKVFGGLRNSRISWEKYRDAQAADFFWASGGATVTIEDVREIVYIANMLPSTVHSVKAKRFLNGNEFLLSVPTEFYDVRQTDYTGYSGVMEIVFQRPLSVESKETGGGWSDDIYVTLTSSVGPNTVDIIKFFIDTYTSFSTDSTSFDDVRTKLENYPMHFPLLRRPNLLNILQDLARKARCALWQRDDIFFIKYLAETPTPVATLTFDDIIKDNPDDSGRTLFKMFLTKTEDLITKQTAKWRKDYSPFITKDNTLILRHNITRYGTHANEEDYFPFVHLDIVRKSATFWLIRTANTWKKLKISTSLAYTLLEPFDAVTLRLNDLARDGSGNTIDVLGVVEKAILDSKGKRINLEIWTPVRAGELIPYDFAFPADIAESALYPTIEARNAGEAGSGTNPNFVTIAPPGHPLRVDHGTVFSGFSLACNGDPTQSFGSGDCRQDHGDQKPSDEGDKKPEVDVDTDDQTDEINGGSSPISNGAGYAVGSSQFLQDEHTKKTEGDAGRGREVAEGGGTGDSPASGDSGSEDDTIEQPLDEDFLNSLPDADDVQAPFKCVVVMTGFPTTLGGAQISPTCLPGTSFMNEKYAYDNRQAAKDLCSIFLGRTSCGGIPPCSTCVNACVITCTGDESQAGNGALIGFTPGTGNPNVILDQ